MILKVSIWVNPWMEPLEVSLHLFQQFGTQDVGLHPRTCKWIICDRSEFKAMEWAAIAVSVMWKKGKLVLSALSNCWITAQFVKLICWYGLFCGGAYLMFLDTSWSSSTFGMGLNHCFGVIKFHSHPTQAFNPTTCKASRDPCTPMRSSLTPFSPAHPCSCHSHATCDMP